MGFDRAGFDREVGLRLQRARKSRGITQEQLAKRVGLPRPSYANIESGRQRIPLDVVWRVAVVLGLSIAALVPEPASRKRAAPPVVVSIAGSLLPTFTTAAPQLTSDVGSSILSPVVGASNFAPFGVIPDERTDE
jgi:transcriptional regulator with XRE-family HTH domain